MGNSGEKTEQQLQTKMNSFFVLQGMISKLSIVDIQRDYELLHQIGSGTFGTVYRAKQRRTGLLRAVKNVVKAKAKQGLQLQRMLQNEFQILKEVDHPNIMKIFGFEEDAKHYYIITELIEGRDLFDIFRERKRFEEKEAYAIFSQVCMATVYLHNRNIMHRDLKIENILYNEQAKLMKLIDFGSAIHFEDHEPKERKLVGSINYLPPEVISKFYNQKCDIWSLGVILYVLFSGSVPFRGTGDQQIKKSILNDEPEFGDAVWEHTNPQIIQLLRKMLQKDPKKRMNIDEILNHPWMLKMRNAGHTDPKQQQQLIACYSNMLRFKTIQIKEIQVGILIFMINFICDLPQASLAYCFNQIDRSADGVIGEQELADGFVEDMDMKMGLAKLNAHEIVNKIDFNNSKSLDYSQFTLAAVNLKMVLTENNLTKTFNYIDTDGNRALSLKEIKAKLGEDISQENYTKLMQQFSINEQGQINMNVFISGMLMILDNY